MRLIKRGVYRCTMCDVVVEAPPRSGKSTPVTTLVANSGKPTERVVTIAGVEVHRCQFPQPERRRD